MMRIQKAAFICTIREEPAFAEMFIAHMLDRSIRIESDLIDQLFNSSERRLARLLVFLANLDKGEKLDPAVVKISQEILAEKIGTTRARVSHFMNKFRKLGYIEYKGDIRVHRSLSRLILDEQPPDPNAPPQIKT
jgi:CRP-like cAMP-binding protein